MSLRETFGAPFLAGGHHHQKGLTRIRQNGRLQAPVRSGVALHCLTSRPSPDKQPPGLSSLTPYISSGVHIYTYACTSFLLQLTLTCMHFITCFTCPNPLSCKICSLCSKSMHTVLGCDENFSHGRDTNILLAYLHPTSLAVSCPAIVSWRSTG